MNFDQKLLGEARRMRLYLVLAIVTGLLLGVVIVLQALYLSRAVSRAYLGGQSLDQVMPVLTTLLAIIVARAALVWVRELTASQTAARIKANLRDRLVSHLMALDPVRFRGERSGELVNTAMEGVESLEAYFSQYLPNLALATLVPLSILIFVFPLDSLSGLVLLVTAPLLPLFMILIGKIADVLTKKQWDSLSRLSAHFLDVLQGLTTLKLFGRSKIQIEFIGQISDQFRDATMRVLRVAFLSALALELLATLSTAMVAVEVGLRLLYATITFEQAFFVLLLAPEFYAPLRALGASFHAGMSGVAAAQRVFAVLQTPAKATGTPDAHVSAAFAEIRFEQVEFTYPDSQRPALGGVTFRLVRGERVALVGPTGAGKSTVANLMLGFSEPQRGVILVDGLPLGRLSLQTWREQLTWVPQQPYLFHATVAENIALARPGATEEEIRRAAALANAHAFISRLPKAYDTLIGERGARLSGGQAQLLALARAFLKGGSLLIMDEAAANLDPEQAALIQEATGRLMADRTVLLISHRLETVYRADRIVVLAGGRVVEEGTHQVLLARKGPYHRMVAAHGGAV